MGNNKSKQSAVIVPSPAPATKVVAAPVTVKMPTLEERNTASIAALWFGTNAQRDLYRVLKERWFRVVPSLEQGLIEFYEKGWALYQAVSYFSVGRDRHRCFHYNILGFPERDRPHITTFIESQDQINKTIKVVQDSNEPYYVFEMECSTDGAGWGGDPKRFYLEYRFDKAGLIKFYENLLPKMHLLKVLDELPLCKDVNNIIADYAA